MALLVTLPSDAECPPPAATRRASDQPHPRSAALEIRTIYRLMRA